MIKYLITLLLGATCAVGSLYLWNGAYQKTITVTASSLSTQKEGPVELVISVEEQAAMDRCKSLNREDEGVDKPAYLYLVGVKFEIGEANAEFAFEYYARSASFGFGPSLAEIARSYLSENYLGLGTVYINLTIASGHPEYAPNYYKYRSKQIELFGKQWVDEIERIAIHKRKLISLNKGKKHLEEVNITDEDLLFDDAYWKEVWKGNAPENLEQWLKEPAQVEKLSKGLAQGAKKRVEILDMMRDSIQG